MDDKDEKPQEPHDEATCAGCGARKRDSDIADQLSTEITQAINRAISKSDDGIDVSTLAAPLAINIALVLMKWELEGNSFEDGLERVGELTRRYRLQIIENSGPPAGNA